MKNSGSLPDIVDLEDGWRPLAELGVEHGAELVGGGDQNQLHYTGSYSTHVGGPHVNCWIEVPNRILVHLKVPKREIFVTEFFILGDPIWVGDLRTKPKKPFV
jgi:hypothetical protein